MKNDVILSKNRWENIYKKSSWKVDYRNDPTVAAYIRFLNKYKKYYQRGRFLDLGCGIAWTSAVLARDNISITGIDISPQAIQQSKSLFKRDNLEGNFIQADLLSLPLKNKSADFIYSCMSLEYFRDTQKAIDEAHRVLKPKGVMVAIVPVISLTTLTYHQLRGDIPQIPLIRDIMEWIHFKLFKAKYMHYGYEKSFTPTQLRSFFTKSGFKVKNIGYFDGYYPIMFVPQIIRPYAQAVLKYRLFWPLMYVEAHRKE